MTTLAVMKDRIRRELRRGNALDADLGPAIETAIDAYRSHRWWWSESRTVAVFNTVAGTEFYNAASPGASALARLKSIDYVLLYISNQPFRLQYMRPAEMDAAAFGMAPGQPSYFAWYDENLRLYPMPADVYQLRVAGVFSVAAPALEGEIGNPWMTHAERLIRSRAKLELALHRLRDQQLAQDMAAAVDDAFAQLKGETAGKVGTGYVETFW